MSISKKLFIAYCEENKNVAKEISQKLKRAGYKFELVSNSSVKNNSCLVDLIMDQDKPGLILISDNYLKSETCMQKMLSFLNNDNEIKNVQAIITDGRYPAESGNGYTTVETAFYRVNNVIKYMNFWQERYLGLRKEKRSIPTSEADSFEEKLSRVKSVSSEIGDFLRILRTKEHYSLHEFEKNDFDVFFKKYGDDGLYQKYQSSAANDPKKESKNIESDLSQIPGMDLLKQASEKEIVMPVLEEKVAEIDVKNVENISAKMVEEELTPVVEDVPSESISDGRMKKQTSNTTAASDEVQEELTNSFEEQVDQIVEELEQEEIIEEGEIEEQSAINQNTEENVQELDELDTLFEEDEEDITADFDPTAEIIAENVDEETDEAKSSNTMDQMIFDASNMIESGKIDDAIIKLKEVLNEEPENNGARYMYAMILYNYKEDYDGACNQLQKLVKFDPRNAEAFEHLGKIAEINNDFLKAMDYYEKVASLKPHTFGIYYKLGLITSGFFMKKKKKAFKYFKKAINQDKDNVDAHYRLGVLYGETFNQPKKAKQHFKKVLDLDPQHQFANYDLALLYNEAGDQKKAAKFYKKAYQLNPEIKTPENDIVFSFDKSSTQESGEIAAVTESILSEENITPDQQTEKGQKVETEPGKVVFITGATSGIGKATAELFAAKGYRLILNGRRSDRLKMMQKEFENDFETDSKILPFDVRNILDVKQAINELDDEWRQVDILINNAGLAKGKAPIHEGELDHWETMIDTNIKGLLYLTRAISPFMVKRQSGQIINVCSSAGHEVYPEGNVYCATKFAVDALTKSMRLDLHKHKIRVGQVSPGHVEETEFAYVRHENEEKAKIYEDFQPLKSKDVAEAIYFMVTAPPHVNIQDIQMMGTQQASNIFIDRSGR